jgi:hypothetical protein
MKGILRASTIAGFGGLTVLASAYATAEPPSRALSELAGRTAGSPQQCVPVVHNSSLRIADPQTVVYGNGGTIWVNRLDSNCLRSGPSNVVVVEPMGTQYCRGDRIQSVDPVSKIPGPYCRLGDFVPYRR